MIALVETVQLDTTFWPVAVATFRGAADDKEFDRYLRWLDAILVREEPYALIVNATEAVEVPWRLRFQQAGWMRRNFDAVRNYAVGTAFVIDSVVVRSIFRTILRLQYIPCPYTVSESYAEAVLWTGEQLQLANHPLPLGFLDHGMRTLGRPAGSL